MKRYNKLKIYSKFLTILIIVLTIFLIILVGYAIYTLYDNYTSDQSSEELMAQFENNYEEIEEGQISEENPSEGSENQEQPSEGNNNNSNPSKPSTKKPSTSSGGSSGSAYNLGTFYKGYKVIGIISIPKLKIQYPIFNVDNTATLKFGTAAIYPANVEEALNAPGNVVIAGHNYRNKRMFSKLYTLQNGDSIFITNIYGVTLEYKVYNNYTAGANDFDYATRETNGRTEISLTTCTSDASTRTIVWARVE